MVRCTRLCVRFVGDCVCTVRSPVNSSMLSAYLRIRISCCSSLNSKSTRRLPMSLSLRSTCFSDDRASSSSSRFRSADLTGAKYPQKTNMKADLTHSECMFYSSQMQYSRTKKNQFIKHAQTLYELLVLLLYSACISQ